MENQSDKRFKKSFDWIKKNLDPLKSYIVFENDLNKQDDSILSESFIAYQYLNEDMLTWQKVFDVKKLKEYLVIQIDPGNEEEKLGKIMGYGFPKETVSYLYKAKS
ncbi:MAG: hypothetical protein GY729_18820 [Desulfobacteraceae bacterium]|nr:hypothetical protein [Desulfobacteraceae bacterium]